MGNLTKSNWPFANISWVQTESQELFKNEKECVVLEKRERIMEKLPFEEKDIPSGKLT